MSGSDYEAWVSGLRRWRRDPSASLADLPALTADSLPPEAYARLFTHLNSAVEGMMADFSERFTRGLGEARSEHDMARVIVGLRGHLARRIQLARHPKLPPQIQKPLFNSASRDISALQADLERIVGSSATRAGSDRTHTERMLKLVRDNSFTAILAPGFPIDSLFTTSGAGTAGHPTSARVGGGAAPRPAPVPTHSGPIRRRVLLGDETSAPPR